MGNFPPERITANASFALERPNTEYVGPGSKWANPFTAEGTGFITPPKPDNVVMRLLRRLLVPLRLMKPLTATLRPASQEQLVRLFKAEMTSPEREDNRRAIRKHLAGKDLACTCGLNEVCHGDVLLEIANG